MAHRDQRDEAIISSHAYCPPPPPPPMGNAGEGYGRLDGGEGRKGGGAPEARGRTREGGAGCRSGGGGGRRRRGGGPGDRGRGMGRWRDGGEGVGPAGGRGGKGRALAGGSLKHWKGRRGGGGGSRGGVTPPSSYGVRPFSYITGHPPLDPNQKKRHSPWTHLPPTGRKTPTQQDCAGSAGQSRAGVPPPLSLASNAGERLSWTTGKFLRSMQ